MSAEPNLTDHDYELLSAYIDGALSDSERAALEARLQTEPTLNRELATLRQTVALLRDLPALKAPRDFTLDAGMVTPRPTRRVLVFPAAFSALSAAAAMVLFVFGAYFLLQAEPVQPGITASQPMQEIAAMSTQAIAPDRATIMEAAADDGSDEAEMLAEAPMETFAFESADDTGMADLEAAPPAAIADPIEEMQPTERQRMTPMAAAGESMPHEEADVDGAESQTGIMMQMPEATTPTPAPTPPAVAPLAAPDTQTQRMPGAVLLAAGVLLFGLAIITTILRRRQQP